MYCRISTARTSTPAASRSGFLSSKVHQRNYSSTVAKDDKDKRGFLILEDGVFTKGKSFAAPRSISGEVVFTTGMVGYPESITDPSYRGQILCLTYPLIGNYGVPDPHKKDVYGIPLFFESERPQISGLIIGSYSEKYSHWNAVQSLGEWLRRYDIPALHGIDTRTLTKKLREKGSMKGKIVMDDHPHDDVEFEDIYQRNLVDEVSRKEAQSYGSGDVKILAVDCGIKNNMIRYLVGKGATVKVVPWNHDITAEDYDGLFLANGPGDPSTMGPLVSRVRKCMNEKNKPIFGICMGNQVLALAAGGKTYKLKYGNRGQNQPCIDQFTGRCYITSQNHGFAVDNNSLPHEWRPYFINANDFSNEGMIHTSKPFFSVQFHPEARAGPYDTTWLFDQFLDKVREVKHGKVFKGFDFIRKDRTNISKVLILGSGGLQIGQAGEFDYSGSQAIKALKEEGVKTVLVNPNIATIQTGKGEADRVYFLPVTTEYVEEIIKKERPDGIMLGFGGQTALNTGVDLFHKGILQKYGVKVLGTQVDTIIATEDRDLFKQKLAEINVSVAESEAVEKVDDALKVAEKIGYPVIIRVAYALGGLGSGFAEGPAELKELATKALANAPQILVEKSVKGWKEVEYEVVRDRYNNTITVCNMENFDPMGIHTGESIVVAPSQTLSNEEYHKLRTIGIKTIQHLQIIGECNIQYALDPKSEDYAVIEVNARLSRSSALASKATGYPLAFVAAKLGLGIPLPEIRNSVTKLTTACFEPALDYIVVKMPRWDLTKFHQVAKEIGSSMKSVGEVMSVGRSFEEALQKAIRMVNTSNTGFDAKEIPDLDKELKNPTDMRIFALAKALQKGYSVDKLHDMTKIDKWFLHKLVAIDNVRNQIRGQHLDKITTELLWDAKRHGFSDLQIAKLVKAPTNNPDAKVDEILVRKERKSRGILPVVKQIDTLSAEFPAYTNYLYTTYCAKHHDIDFDQKGIMVLGSGVYRIGSSVEFDYCAVSTVRSLRKMGVPTIMVNYNPETVSTDYDESDRLYFEELSLERVLDIYEVEKCSGVVVSVGGQQPNNIALKLHQNGVNVLGTHPEDIDKAEDRSKFSAILDQLKIAQPEWSELRTMDEAKKFAAKVGFPVLVRPSYVLSGAAMAVVHNPEDLEAFLKKAASVNEDHPVVITKFVEGAKEVELDGVAQDGNLVNWAISEHVENAGVHSGDATLVLPADTIPASAKKEVKDISAKIAKALKINGPCNMQFLYKDGKLSVIECNLRASRSLPFVAKTYDIDFVETAAKVFVGGNKIEPNQKCDQPLPYVCVKAPMFSFQRLLGSDPKLGVEMASTGEVACFGENRYEALIKSMQSARFVMPKKYIHLSTGKQTAYLVPALKKLMAKGYEFFCTPEVSAELNKAGVPHKVLELRRMADKANIIDYLRNQKIDMVINFPENHESDDYYKLRRTSVDFAVPIITNPQLAHEVCVGLATVEKYHVLARDEYPGYTPVLENH